MNVTVWFYVFAVAATAGGLGMLVGAEMTERFPRRREYLTAPFAIAVAAIVWPLTAIVVAVTLVAQIRRKAAP